MGADELSLDIREFGSKGHLLLSTFLDRGDELHKQEIHLRGNEGLILAVI
jgi:hypothetical protein